MSAGINKGQGYLKSPPVLEPVYPVDDAVKFYPGLDIVRFSIDDAFSMPQFSS